MEVPLSSERSATRSGAPLTVVMYHYVRPIAQSQYPGIKGLESAAFEGQLDYIQRHYQVVSVEDVVGAIESRSSLPDSPILLTFDDGYTDHFLYVYQSFKKRGIAGAFFPPVNAVRDRVVLDVNKIHFILQAPKNLLLAINCIDKAVVDNGLDEVAAFKAKFATPSRYDTAETMYVKRMLQFALPVDLRKLLVDQLFRELVSSDERTFAEELYVSEENLREMIDGGMTVGGHGFSHNWLNRLSDSDQDFEIEQSIQWLLKLGVEKDNLTFCYPYGGYNSHTLSALSKSQCRLAVTTKVALNDLASVSPLEIARIDTNDLPQYSTAEPSYWTKRSAILPG